MKRHAALLVPSLLIVSVVLLVSDMAAPVAMASPRKRRTAAPGPAPVVSAVNLPLKALRVNPDQLAGGNDASGTVELFQAPGPGGDTVKGCIWAHRLFQKSKHRHEAKG
jgi:hypothetical protein